MHIYDQDVSSLNKKDFSFKASHENKGKAKVQEEIESSSDEGVNDMKKLALMVRKTTKMLKLPVKTSNM
jgi:hypothetical protein